MKKILLILEDFAERAFLSTLLKKVGWDVEVAQSEVGINNLILSFSPDIILVNAFGNKVKGEFLALKLQNSKKLPLIYLITKGRRLTDEQLTQLKVSGFFESPVDVKRLFEALESRGGIKASSAFQKLSQQRKSSTPDQSKKSDGNTSKSKLAPPVTADKSSNMVSSTKTANTDSDSKTGDKKSDLFEETGIENPQEAMQRAKDKLDSFRFSDPDRRERNARYVKQNKLEDSNFNGIKKSFVDEQVSEFRATEDDPELKDIDEERKSFVKAMFEMSKK